MQGETTIVQLGCVNLYKFNKEKKSIQKVNEIGGLPGSLNCIKFSKGNSKGPQNYKKAYRPTSPEESSNGNSL